MKKPLVALCALLGCVLASWAQLQLDAGQSYSFQFTPQMFTLGFSGDRTSFSTVFLSFSGFDPGDSLRLEVSRSAQTLSTTAVEPGRNIFFGSFYIGDGAMRLEVLSGSISLEGFAATWNAAGPAPDFNYMGSTGLIPVPEPHPILFLFLLTLIFLGHHLRRRFSSLRSNGLRRLTAFTAHCRRPSSFASNWSRFSERGRGQI